jgi:hypothetical protein
MSAIDFVLQSYRDTFGVKTEKANEIHREACVEVSNMRDALEAYAEKHHENMVSGILLTNHKGASWKDCPDELCQDIARLTGAK